MTKKEMNLRVFEGRKIPGILFQPRVEPWFDWHKQFNNLPDSYRDMNLLQFIDEFDLSMRYIHYYTGSPDPVEAKHTDKIKIDWMEEGDKACRVIHTPLGDLVEGLKKTVDKVWRTLSFPVKSTEDLEKLKSYYQNTQFHFNRDKFQQGIQFMGERGEPQFWVPKSPYQAFCQQWMKLDHFIFALDENPTLVEEIMQAIDDSYNPLYEDIINSHLVKIINFGENIHVQLLSPRYFERYLIPFYEKRSNQLRDSGIFTHIHIDGYFNPLLKYLKTLPFDGYEALTPYPQGDMSLEEIKESIGDKILLDGIPAVLFLSHYSMEELQQCVKKIISLFAPRLILGISDELPEGENGDCLKKLSWVSEYCKCK